MADLSKTGAQWLLHWQIYLGKFPYEIMHIAGEMNCWGDLL